MEETKERVHFNKEVYQGLGKQKQRAN